MDLVNYQLLLTGRVQGVSFRYFACRQAEKLGVTGWVKNNSDGSVSLEIEGPPSQVDKMVEWCRHGPPWAKVTHADVHPGRIHRYPSFKITSE